MGTRFKRGKGNKLLNNEEFMSDNSEDDYWDESEDEDYILENEKGEKPVKNNIQKKKPPKNVKDIGFIHSKVKKNESKSEKKSQMIEQYNKRQEVKKELRDLANEKHFQLMENRLKIREVLNEQLPEIIIDFHVRLNKAFPTIEELKDYAKTSGKISYCVLNAKFKNSFAHQLTLHNKTSVLSETQTHFYTYKGHGFRICNFNPIFKSNKIINIKYMAISYKYIYNYMKNKELESYGKPRSYGKKHGLYYEW